MMTDIDRIILERDILRMIVLGSLRGRFTAREVCRLHNQIYKQPLDWHEFSYALDNLRTTACLDLVGHDTSGMCIYEVKR